MDLTNGIGQGDPFSMVSYLLYNADLIEIAGDKETDDALGYIDDVVAMAIGDDFEQTTDQLWTMMTKNGGSEQWSKEHNSEFEINKFAVMHCTQQMQQDPHNHQQHIPLNCPPLVLQGQVIKGVNSYTYLGVEIDDQLHWHAQAKKGMAKAKQWNSLYGRLTRPSTGLNSKFMRQLYITVAIPKMTYALEVWYTPPTQPAGSRRKTGSVRVLNCMQSLQ